MEGAWLVAQNPGPSAWAPVAMLSHPCCPPPQVVCAKCSDYRAELKYDGNRPNRVCLACYTFLTGNVLPDCKEDKRRGILEVRAGSILPTLPFPEDSVLGSEKQATKSRLPSSFYIPAAPSPPVQPPWA